MQDEKQGPNRARTDKRNTGGLPVARDATQLDTARRTPESQGRHDEDPGVCHQGQERGAPPVER